MVRFRQLKSKDSRQIDIIYRKYHQEDFYIPKLDSFTLSAGVVVDDKDDVVAFGMVRLIPEVIMVMDLGRSKRTKVTALRELMSVAIMDTVRAGLDSLHAFVQDNGFSHLLKKHYGFRSCTGEAIITEVK